MKEVLQDPWARFLISGITAVVLAFVAYKVPAIAPVATLVGTMLIPATYKTTKPGAGSDAP